MPIPPAPQDGGLIQALHISTQECFPPDWQSETHCPRFLYWPAEQVKGWSVSGAWPGCGGDVLPSGRASSAAPTGSAAATVSLPGPRLDGSLSVEEALARRRSVREYADAPLTLEQLQQEADRKRLRAGALYDEFQELRRWGRMFCDPAGPGEA